MRKNGVNRELTAIDGGVCAPSGFRVGAIYGGFSSENTKKTPDLAVVLADKPYTAAFVGAAEDCAGAAVCASRKNAENGRISAVLVNSGVALSNGKDAEDLVEMVCREAAKQLKIDKTDVVLCSTGALGKTITLQPFSVALEGISGSLGDTHEHSLAAARAMMTADKTVKQLSYSFELGDITCKIGAICKGSARVAPNMSTTLCVLTTDINISPKMLQKALHTAVNDTLNMTQTDGVCSLNDCVCILASGEAGNWRIEENDSEYKKFSHALSRVMERICLEIVSDCEQTDKPFVCKVCGARSKQAARAMAKAVISALRIKRDVAQGSLNLTDLLCAIGGVGEHVDYEKLSITVRSTVGEMVVFEDGRTILGNQALFRIFQGEGVAIELRFAQGNYAATAYGCAWA